MYITQVCIHFIVRQHNTNYFIDNIAIPNGPNDFQWLIVLFTIHQMKLVYYLILTLAVVVGCCEM